MIHSDKSRRRLFGFLQVILAASAVSTAFADDAGIIIATGHKEGGYYRIGENLSAELRENGLSAHPKATAGSLENLTALSDPADPVSVALVQTDALLYFTRQQRDSKAQVIVLDDWGMECVFLVVSAASQIHSDSDVQDADRLRLAMASPDSGAAVTWRYMTQLEQHFAGIEPVYMDLEAAIAGLSMPPELRPADAVMFVQHPKARPPEMRQVLENLDQLRFVRVIDESLDDEVFDGQRAYSLEKFTPVPMKPIEVETICTRRLIVANSSKMRATDLQMLRRVIDKSRWSLYRTDESE